MVSRMRRPLTYLRGNGDAKYGPALRVALLDMCRGGCRGGLGTTFFGLEVGNNVLAEEPQRVFHLRIGGRPGLEDGHNLIGSHALVVFHHFDALIRGPDAEATGGEDLLGADALAHLGIPLHTTHMMAVAV